MIITNKIATTLAREKGGFEAEGLIDDKLFATGTDEQTLFEMNLVQIHSARDTNRPKLAKQK